MMTAICLETVCNAFKFEGKVDKAEAYGDGHINDTYKVTCQADREIHYILQRINHEIFTDVKGLMDNIAGVTAYLRDILADQERLGDYEVLELIKTKTNDNYHQDEKGNYWRAYVFVEKATGHTFATKPSMLYEAGKAFGRFANLLNDYPANTLTETIRHFHHTANRYKNFESVLALDPLGRTSDCGDDIAFVLERKSLTEVIVSALDDGSIPWRVTHNDTKINNVLLDDASGIGRCVIDLDTVMPGTPLYDYGDAIRSCGSNLAEDAENLEDLRLDMDRFEAYTKGYLTIMGDVLSPQEIQLLPTAAILMTFECGTRFLTDHLAGDNYFKIHKPNHNLIRARNQFKFVQVMEAREKEMMAVIEKCLSNK